MLWYKTVEIIMKYIVITFQTQFKKGKKHTMQFYVLAISTIAMVDIANTKNLVIKSTKPYDYRPQSTDKCVT